MFLGRSAAWRLGQRGDIVLVKGGNILSPVGPGIRYFNGTPLTLFGRLLALNPVRTICSPVEISDQHLYPWEGSYPFLCQLQDRSALIDPVIDDLSMGARNVQSVAISEPPVFHDFTILADQYQERHGYILVDFSRSVGQARDHPIRTWIKAANVLVDKPALIPVLRELLSSRPDKLVSFYPLFSEASAATSTDRGKFYDSIIIGSVSYTHLTLPTICSV